jgi:hypothetical protein
MTRRTSARLAGFTFLFYIAIAMPSMMLFDGAASGMGIAAKLAGIAAHAPAVRISIVLSLITCFAAPVLAVGLYGITRDEDQELAVLALACRVGEGVLGAIPTAAMLGLLWLATSTSGAGAPDQALAAILLKVCDWMLLINASFFAIGSTIFSWLLLRGRMVPVPLAWLGVLASILVAVLLPLQLAGYITWAMGWFVWIPMLVFEVTLGLWLLIKGVAARPIGEALAAGHP